MCLCPPYPSTLLCGNKHRRSFIKFSVRNKYCFGVCLSLFLRYLILGIVCVLTQTKRHIKGFHFTWNGMAFMRINILIITTIVSERGYLSKNMRVEKERTQLGNHVTNVEKFSKKNIQRKKKNSWTFCMNLILFHSLCVSTLTSQRLAVLFLSRTTRPFHDSMTSLKQLQAHAHMCWLPLMNNGNFTYENRKVFASQTRQHSIWTENKWNSHH